jgi:hypothetical protein
MRAEAPYGDQKYMYQYPVTAAGTMELPGSDFLIDVPDGCSAIFRVSGHCGPSGNNLGWGLRLDGLDVVRPQETTSVDRIASLSWKIAPGRHRVSIWIYASTAAGMFADFCMEYVIVRRGPR